MPEIRDAVHNFIHFDEYEKQLIDSKPFQRLRFIHQLSLTYLLYPGANHTRFEHSLGVLEVATRIFDIITKAEDITGIKKGKDLVYWRKVVRLAALCHDLGHLPFSHTGEGLLPPNKNKHDYLTLELIRNSAITKILQRIEPPVEIEHVAKLAVGAKYYEEDLSDWEIILSDIITSDLFGADRIDYLLRDSHHLGVAYGRFDHYRLIDTLRILHDPQTDEGDPKQPALGIELGGIHTIEALLLARFFMFTQVYYHEVRRAYDKHLQYYLSDWLKEQGLQHFPTDTEGILKYSEVELLADIKSAAADSSKPGHIHAMRIITHKHFKLLFEPTLDDLKKKTDVLKALYTMACDEFGEENFILDDYVPKNEEIDFPVITDYNKVVSATAYSTLLNKLYTERANYLFVNRDTEQDARRWREKALKSILKGE